MRDSEYTTDALLLELDLLLLVVFWTELALKRWLAGDEKKKQKGKTNVVKDFELVALELDKIGLVVDVAPLAALVVDDLEIEPGFWLEELVAITWGVEIGLE